MAEDRDRPIFEGGERLRQSTRRPRGRPPRQGTGRDPAEEARRLLPQLERLRLEAAEIPEELRGRRVVFRAGLHREFLAGTHYPKDLVGDVGLQVVGSAPSTSAWEEAPAAKRDGVQVRMLFLAATDAEMSRFERVLRGPEGVRRDAWQDVRKFASLRLAQEPDVLRTVADAQNDVRRYWEVVLHPSTTRPRDDDGDDARLLLERFQAWARKIGGPDAVREREPYVADGLTYLGVRLTEEQARQVAQFNGLRLIRPVGPPPSGALPDPTLFFAYPPLGDGLARTSVRVAVFDGGYDVGCPCARPYAEPFEQTEQAPTVECTTHGTLMTNAVLYGSAGAHYAVAVPVGYVDHYRVLPAPPDLTFPLGDPDMLGVLDRIEDVLLTRDHALATLALGPQEPVRAEDPPHEWTVRLDRLARARNVTLVVAAGNGGRGDRQRGGDRVSPPADMVNGVTAGACHIRHDAVVRRADYSGRGPGRHGGWVRPHLVARAGELASQNAFVGVGPQGRIMHDEGTSYAAGLVTHALVPVVDALGRERSRPETLRTFAVHFAERGLGSEGPADVGYGRCADDLGMLLGCPENAVTVLYEDAVQRGEVIRLPLPVPDGVPPQVELDVRFTLCYTSPVDPSDVAGYTQAGFEYRLRPNSRLHDLLDEETGTRVGVVDVWAGDVMPETLNGRRVRVAPHPRQHAFNTQRGTEQRLRHEGKWDTTISKRFSRPASYFHSPVLDLVHLHRFRGALVATKKRPTLRYTMLVTVSTPEEVPLYAMAKQQFGLVGLGAISVSL